MKSLRLFVKMTDKKFRVKSAREPSVRREAAAAIRSEFSDSAIHAIVSVSGVDAAATTIAGMAMRRAEMIRNGKRPMGGTEP